MSGYTHLTVREVRLAVAEAVGDDRDVLAVVRARLAAKRRAE